MKKISFLFLIALISACSVGTNKDLSTGLSYSYNGFAVDGVYFVGPDNKPKSTNEVDLNSKVAIVMQGLKNYELKDGKAFPGLMLTVADKAGNFVINEADLFGDGNGYSPEDASILRGTVTVGKPMESGETYIVRLKVWDKSKIENELTAEVSIVVK